MNQKQLEAFAREAAKSIKRESDLEDFQRSPDSLSNLLPDFLTISRFNSKT